jgi:hypothetical protein
MTRDSNRSDQQRTSTTASTDAQAGSETPPQARARSTTAGEGTFSHIDSPAQVGRQTRRRLLTAGAVGAASFLAGCGGNSDGGDGGDASPEGDTPGDDGESPTPTDAPGSGDTPSDTGTPDPNERAQQVIERARSVYGDALNALSQAQVVVIVEGALELRLEVANDFQPYRELDTEAQLGPVRDVRAKANDLIEKVSEDATRQAVAEMAAIGFYIEEKYDQYGKVVSAFTNAAAAFRAYGNGNPRAGVSPSRAATSDLAAVSESRELLEGSLEELNNKNDYQADFDGWDYEYEANIQKFMARIVFEFSPAFNGLTSLLTGTVVESDAVEKYRNESYSESIAFAQDAGDRYTQGSGQLGTALERNVRYFPNTFQQMACLCDDSGQDVTLLEEAAREAANGEMSASESTFNDYKEAASSSDCGGETETATSA